MKSNRLYLAVLLLALAAPAYAGGPIRADSGGAAVVLQSVEGMHALARGGQKLRFTGLTEVQHGGEVSRGRAAVELLAPGMLVRLLETRALAGGVLLVTRMEVMPQ